MVVELQLNQINEVLLDTICIHIYYTLQLNLNSFFRISFQLDHQLLLIARIYSQIGRINVL